ncbi:MAG: ATP-binding protein [Bdellovibrionaceae bacterium]|nr:ATP-binding protein [Pseudobdellovibrionaceae bacterium]
MYSFKKISMFSRSRLRTRHHRQHRDLCDPSHLLELSTLSDQALRDTTQFIKCRNIISLPSMDPQDPRSLLVICAQIIEVKRALRLLPKIGEDELKDIVHENLSAHESVRHLVDELCTISKRSRLLIEKNLRLDFQNSLLAGLEFLEKEFSHTKYNRSIINFISLHHNEIERDIIFYIIERGELLTNLMPSHSRTNDACSVYNITEHLAEIYPVKNLQKHLSPSSSIFDSGLIDLEEESIANTEKWEDVELEFTGNLHASDELFSATPSTHFKWKKTFDPIQKIDDVILPEREKKHLLHLLEDFKKSSTNESNKRLTFLFEGAPGTGKSMTAEAIAQSLGMKVMRIQMGEFAARSMPSLISFATARAKNRNIMLLFDECENLIWRNYKLSLSSPWMKIIFEEFSGVACFTTNYSVPEDFVRRITYYINFKSPVAEIRSKILKNELQKISKAGVDISNIAPLQIEAIAADFGVPGGFYPQALQLAKALESEDKITEPTLRESLLTLEEKFNFQKYEATREAKNKIEQIHLDITQKNILSKLIEFNRKKQPSQNLKTFIPRTALFFGPPGTGKTMAAEVVAFELGLKIRTVTPSSFLSAYVGETEKNIRKVFREAESDPCVLFIDEAEGLLLDRSHAKVSWEKTQANEFLNAIESFRGILIAATNWTSMMDPAFARRFVFHLEFKAPDANTRRQIWNSFKDYITIKNINLNDLADNYELTGGEIRNVAIKCMAYDVQDHHQIEDLCKSQLLARTGETLKTISIK